MKTKNKRNDDQKTRRRKEKSKTNERFEQRRSDRALQRPLVVGVIELELLVVPLGQAQLDDVEVRVREVGVREAVSETESRLDVI